MTDLAVIAAVAGGALLAFLTGVWASYRRGKRQARFEMELDDYENAADIRRRVRDAADIVRENDGRNFRD